MKSSSILAAGAIVLASLAHADEQQILRRPQHHAPHIVPHAAEHRTVLEQPPAAGPGAKRARAQAAASHNSEVEVSVDHAGHHESPTSASAPYGSIAHAAATGNVAPLVKYATRNNGKSKHLLMERDANGWSPIHLAARGGHLDAVQFFLYYGADVNEKTNFGEGQSVLGLVQEYHGAEHPLYTFLEHKGAKL